MQTAILVRHAESVLSACGAVNGDPNVPAGLSPAGHEQARALGVLLADDELHLCVTSEMRRTQETADVALAGRDVPRLVVPELNDIRFGSFEDGLLTEYRAWAHAHAPADDCPGGGESRVDAALRFTTGFRKVLGRRETRILVVGHGLPIRYVLSALVERDPSAVVEPVAYAEPFRVSAAQLERAVERLEAWTRDPVFA